jgi:hypothetical protein
VLGVAVDAEVTVTLACDELGLASHPGCERAGTLEIFDIGVPARLAAQDRVHVFLSERTNVETQVPGPRLGDQGCPYLAQRIGTVEIQTPGSGAWPPPSARSSASASSVKPGSR